MTHDEDRISDLIDGGLHEKSAIDRAKYELHLRRKAAIEEAANRMIRDGETLTTAARFYLKMGMQEVIEHPERYGLYTEEQYEQALKDGYNQGLADGARQTVDYVNKNIFK